MKFSNRFKWWRIYGTGVALCGLATVGAYAASVRPLAARRHEEQARIRELETRERKAAELTANLDLWQRQLVSANRLIEQSPVRLQAASLVNQRLAQLAALAATHALSIDEMQPGALVDATFYRTLAIRIVGTGTYPSVAEFLRELRARFRDMGVGGFRVSAENAAPGSAAAKFQIELNWFTAPAGK